MKKIYFLLTALLISLSGWAFGNYSAYYLNVPGEHNNWGDNGVLFNNAGYAANTISNLASNEFKLKIWTGSENWRGNGDKSLQTRKWYTVNSNGDNMKINGGSGGYKVEYNWDSKQMRITPANYNPNYSTWSVNIYGDYNNNADNTGSVTVNNNMVTFEKVAIGAGYFGIKVTDGTDNTYYVYTEANVPTNTATKLYPYGSQKPSVSSCKMKVSGAAANKKYNVTFNVATEQITIVEATEDPVIDFTSLTYENLTSNSATLKYTYSTRNFTSTPNIKVEYKKDGDSQYTDAGTYSDVSKTGTINLSGLTEKTPYKYYVRLSANGADSKEMEVEFTTLRTVPYTVYFDTKGWTGGSATPSCYVWENDNNNNGWPGKEMQNLEGSVWSFEIEDGSYTGIIFNWLEGNDRKQTSDYVLEPNHIYTYNLVKGSTGEEYTPPVQKVWPPTIVISEHKNAINGVNKGAMYFTAAIVNDDKCKDAAIYYSLDNENWMLYRAEFQIPGTCTVYAYAVKDGEQSETTNQSHQKSDGFDWETEADAAKQMTYYRIEVANVEPVIDLTTGRYVVEIADTETLTETTESRYKGGSIYSWAKYFDADAFEADHNTEEEIEASDHCTTESKDILDFFGPNVQDNTTSRHICRNYAQAMYRVYVHSDVVPALLNSPNSLKGIKTYGENDNPTSTWTTVPGTTAGNVDPNAAARIAYTTVVPGEDKGETTGIEDIVATPDDADADTPVVYYNLQGVRVHNPASGIYIRVQGKKVTKEYVR